MGDIEQIYEDLETAEISLEEFREAVEAKVEQMGGLADEETAAMLIAHELDDGGEVSNLAEVEAGMEEVTITGKVTSIGELRSFERDDEDRPEGRVLNANLADETGSVRITFWDEHAEAAEEELEVDDVIDVNGRPKDGLGGVEIDVDDVQSNPDVEIDVDWGGPRRIANLDLGASDVTLLAEVLATEPVRTFDRDDGSEGQVSNLLVGDETGRVRVTLWDDQAETAEELEAGETIELMGGSVRERDGSLEVHVGDRGAIEPAEEPVSYEPDATPIEEVSLEDTADIAGVIRSSDPKRTFDRDDGSEGQVRNVRVQDDTGDIRVALWGEKADRNLGPGEEVLFVDVLIKEGWQDDLEASANWRSTIVPLDAEPAETEEAERDSSKGLAAFAGREDSTNTTGADGDSQATEAESDLPADGEDVSFTGVVVQAGEPIIIDDGEQTMTVEGASDVELGEQITVTGEQRGGTIDADSIE